MTKPLSAEAVNELLFAQGYFEMPFGPELEAIRDGHHVVITAERLRELEEYEWKYKELCK